MLKKITRNSLFFFSNHVFETVINIIVTWMIANHFQTTGYGALSLFAIFIFAINTLDSIWFRPIAVRELSQAPQHSASIFHTLIRIRMVYSVIILIVFYIITIFLNIPPQYKHFPHICALSIILIGFINTYFALFQHSHMLHKFILPNMVGKLLLLSIVYLAIATKISITFYYILSIIPSLLLLLYFHTYVRINFEKSPTIIITLFNTFFKKSIPLFISGLFIILYHRIDHFMLYTFFNYDTHIVGIYGLSTKLIEQLTIIPIALTIPLLPIFSRLWINNKEAFTKLYSVSFKYLLLLIIPLSFWFFLMSPYIIEYFFDETYIATGILMQILIWSEIFVFLGIVNNTLLTASHNIKYDPLFTGISAVANICLNILLIPKWGMIGAALATLCAYPLGPLLGFFFKATRPFSFSMLRYSIKPFVLSLLVYLLLMKLDTPVYIAAIVFPLAYIGTLVLSRTIRRADWEWLKEVNI